MGNPSGLLEQPTQETRSGIQTLADYPEFCVPGGDRYLKKLLRQILPLALYRTWEIFIDYQARGNDCYLSLPRLAAVAGRSLRTVQKNVASLQARHLLVERVERKLFRTNEGQEVSRLVVVKDFAALYALAHEYHEWLESEEMIPPERLFVSQLIHDSTLIAKLRRFENYRRLLFHHTPAPREREEDRWFTEYHSETEQQKPAPAHTSIMEAKEVSKGMSKVTPERKKNISHRDVFQGDSYDSAAPSSENAVTELRSDPRKPADQSREQGSKNRWKAMSPQTQRPEQAIEGSSFPIEHPYHPANSTVQTVRSARARANPCLLSQHSAAQCSQTPAVGTQSADHPLACSFLDTITVPFGDRNPRGSATRLLNILAHAPLAEPEVVLCLVRAYTIARDTQTIRAAHAASGTGVANRMPLFCTLFERFVQACLHHDTGNYSWQQLEQDLINDDHLHSWWSAYQTCLPPDLHAPPTSSGVDTLKEQGREEDVLPITGWTRREAAHSWGEQLLEALIAAGIEAEVRVHLEDQWYQLLLVGEGCEYVLDTPQEVQQLIKDLQSDFSLLK